MEAKLLWSEKTKDADGFPEEKTTEVDVFVEEREIKRSEFYESLRSGVQITKVLELRIEDFDLSEHEDSSGRKVYASKIKMDKEVYKIIRTYKTGKSKIELICGDE